MYSQYVFVGVPLHTARIACWFSTATTHWSNFYTRDGIDAQTVLSDDPWVKNQTRHQTSRTRYEGMKWMNCAANEPIDTPSYVKGLCFYHMVSRDQKAYPLSLKQSGVVGTIIITFQVGGSINYLLLVPRIKSHLSGFELSFLNIFSRKNLLRSLSQVLFLLQRYKYGSKNVQKATFNSTSEMIRL